MFVKFLYITENEVEDYILFQSFNMSHVTSTLVHCDGEVVPYHCYMLVYLHHDAPETPSLLPVLPISYNIDTLENHRILYNQSTSAWVKDPRMGWRLIKQSPNFFENPRFNNFREENMRI